MQLSFEAISNIYFGNDKSRDYPIQDFVSAYSLFVSAFIPNQAYLAHQVLLYSNSPRLIQGADGKVESRMPEHLVTENDLEQTENIFDCQPADQYMIISYTPENNLFQLEQLHAGLHDALGLKLRILFNSKPFKKKGQKGQKPALSVGGLLAILANKDDFMEEAEVLYAQRKKINPQLPSWNVSKRQLVEIRKFYQETYDFLYSGGQKHQLEILKSFEKHHFHNDDWENGSKYYTENIKTHPNLGIDLASITVRRDRVLLDFHTVASMLELAAQIIVYYRDNFLLHTIHIEMPNLTLGDFIEKALNMFGPKPRKRDMARLKRDLIKLTPTCLQLMQIQKLQPEEEIQNTEGQKNDKAASI